MSKYCLYCFIEVIHILFERHSSMSKYCLYCFIGVIHILFERHKSGRGRIRFELTLNGDIIMICQSPHMYIYIYILTHIITNSQHRPARRCKPSTEIRSRIVLAEILARVHSFNTPIQGEGDRTLFRTKITGVTATNQAAST